MTGFRIGVVIACAASDAAVLIAGMLPGNRAPVSPSASSAGPDTRLASMSISKSTPDIGGVVSVLD
jgi:hypothetical protein